MKNLDFEKWWAEYEAGLGLAVPSGPERKQLKALARSLIVLLEFPEGVLNDRLDRMDRILDAMATEMRMPLTPVTPEEAPVYYPTHIEGPGGPLVDPGHHFKGVLPSEAPTYRG